VHADQILVLDRGEIVERGTHDQLLALRGTYHRLHEAQLRRDVDAGGSLSTPPVPAGAR
jgi:ABC-type transport system involved in cytochrome bd biosynthesis fused ATPase/permease subunit